MEMIRKKIDELNQLNSDWVNMIKKLEEENQNVPDENIELLMKTFMELLDLCKEEYKTDEGILKNGLNNSMNKDDAQWLFDIVNSSLKIYRITVPLRELQNENKEKVKMVIQYIFDNVILRYDPQFIENFVVYELCDEDELTNIARIMDLLTKYYIMKHFTGRAIKEDFQNETELIGDICDYYVSLVERNYLTLQLNNLLDKISE